MQNVEGCFLGQIVKEMVKYIVEEIIVDTAKDFVEDPSTIVSNGEGSTNYGHWGGARP